jgi:hypothetical protein
MKQQDVQKHMKISGMRQEAARKQVRSSIVNLKKY